MPTTFSRYAKRLRNRALYRRVRPYTMIAKYGRIEDNLLIAERQVRKHRLSGSYVECGVWRGGMSFAMMQILPRYGVTDFHFFDSFQGLPVATAQDGADALGQQRNGDLWFDDNTADHGQFLKDLEKFKPAGVTTTVHKGWFEDTLSEFPKDGRIAVLRLDGDWYDSTLVCFQALWDRVIPNGLVLIDDYYDWSGCTNAVHRFLVDRFSADNNFYCPIRSTKYGLAYLVKPD
ncbi:MAG: class I SAM-dependent methyltransferase [Proteobacteria bacterium]|nr:class I SAM-dependent methyltransferase [Pseudomonadota bacterium]